MPYHRMAFASLATACVRLWEITDQGMAFEYHNLIAHTHTHTHTYTHTHIHTHTHTHTSKKGPLECTGRCRRILAMRLRTGYTPVCGDGIVLGIESWVEGHCDDGNLIPGDGCSSECQVECGYTCGAGRDACETRGRRSENK
jgi:cysteine-rich repeat protein